jgi:hypothetical protein
VAVIAWYGFAGEGPAVGDGAPGGGGVLGPKAQSAAAPAQAQQGEILPAGGGGAGLGTGVGTGK